MEKRKIKNFKMAFGYLVIQEQKKKPKTTGVYIPEEMSDKGGLKLGRVLASFDEQVYAEGDFVLYDSMFARVCPFSFFDDTTEEIEGQIVPIGHVFASYQSE